MATDNGIFQSYLLSLPEDRLETLSLLIDTITQNLPHDFEPCIQYKMPSWVVPHHIYPSGYHCDPKTPLPFISIASQKNHIALYHMGIYINQPLLEWFENAIITETGKKPDMGKSCIRFQPNKPLPLAIIGELCTKMQTMEWIALYEEKLKK